MLVLQIYSGFQKSEIKRKIKQQPASKSFFIKKTKSKAEE